MWAFGDKVDLGVSSFVCACMATSINAEFRQHIGGVNGNSFIKIIDNDIDEDDSSICPKIINHSPYYDNKTVLSTLQKCKNKFTLFSTRKQTRKLMN